MRVNDTTILLMAVYQADTAVNCISGQPLFVFMLKKSLGRLRREICIIPPRLVLEMEAYNLIDK